ncbi:SOSS complex subunit B family protein [Halobaculum sp. MBLA0147]|uniref:SOSS complex subunit B family protein n=1 Tax=Halobaculum sp. MBLA0147 TaxID=3079934 RepID=UPI0035256E05
MTTEESQAAKDSGLYRTPNRGDSVPLGAKVDAGAILSDVRAEQLDEPFFGTDIPRQLAEQTPNRRRARTSIDNIEERKTLVTQEKVEGERAERERQRRKAMSTADEDTLYSDRDLPDNLEEARRLADIVDTPYAGAYEEEFRAAIDDDDDSQDDDEPQRATINREQACKEDIVGSAERDDSAPEAPPAYDCAWDDEHLDDGSAPDTSAHTGHSADDPRDLLDEDDVAVAEKIGASLAAYFGSDTALDEEQLTTQAAAKLADGARPLAAQEQIRDDLGNIPGVREKLTHVDPYYDHRVTVKVKVTHLFEDPARNQYQAGYVEDDTGRAKVVFWHSSRKAVGREEATLQHMRPLVEGMTVRLEGAVANSYEGGLSLAITGDTDIIVVEQGDGEVKYDPCPGVAHPVEEPPHSRDADTHAWVNALDTEPGQPTGGAD